MGAHGTERSVRAGLLFVAALALVGCGKSPPQPYILGGDDTGAAGSGSGGGGACGPGTERCGERCVDTEVDPEHCGKCNADCATGEACVGGACTLVCAGGASECGGSCVDFDHDPAHCGECNVSCPGDQVCLAGSCALACSGATSDCDGFCADLQADARHCGECGVACDEGLDCVDGACKLVCTGGTTRCGAACVDLESNPKHCGGCRDDCPDDQVCSQGKCALECVGGTTECDGACVDVENDPSHCGGCGEACEDGEVCTLGACALECRGGTLDCGRCVDTNANAAHCGACNNDCPSDQVCSLGECVDICGSALTDCGQFCVDIQTNPRNCGGCGELCPFGDACVDGLCVACDSASTDCDGDGWMTTDGDCCDRPGLCGSDPELVNPGAVEVVGNGVDDNCNALTDFFDIGDVLPCDTGLASDSSDPADFARALGICRTTTESPETLAERRWGLIDAKLLRVDGTPVGDPRAHSLRPGFGATFPSTLEGDSLVVLSSGIAADDVQTNPGPNTGHQTGHSPLSSVNIQTCTEPLCIDDWFTTANPPLKEADELPVAPGCGNGSSGSPHLANDSVMLVLRMRAPTNVKAFSFNVYFMSVEYPEFVCTSFNDQFVVLVDTPGGTPEPLANPVDKNLATYSQGDQAWPIGINVANATNLFAVCQSMTEFPVCWDSVIDPASCVLGPTQLDGTGFGAPPGGCVSGGGTYWLTTAGNVIPGDIVELRLGVWDVGDTLYDSIVLIDGFRWLVDATRPGTG